MKNLILVKLGGSLITNKNKPYTAKPATIKRLAREIESGWGKGFRFIISHGSGSFGHTSATKYKTADGFKKKKDVFGLAVVQQDALKINRIINEIFIGGRLPCLSFVPSSFTLADNKKLAKIFIEPIIQTLKIDALPLVFGDVILDTKIGCCIFSGEVTLNNLSSRLGKRGFKIKKVIQCGTTDGVYDATGKTIPKITPKNFKKFKSWITESNRVDVTGGMLHKVKESLKIAKLGIDVFIINGKRKGNLYQTIISQPKMGTLICFK